jgi:hypothetical protein
MHGISPLFNKYFITEFPPHRKLCVLITKPKGFLLLGHTITIADENQEKM